MTDHIYSAVLESVDGHVREASRLLVESQRLTARIRGSTRRNYLGIAQLLRAPFRASRLASAR